MAEELVIPDYGVELELPSTEPGVPPPAEPGVAPPEGGSEFGEFALGAKPTVTLLGKRVPMHQLKVRSAEPALLCALCAVYSATAPYPLSHVCSLCLLAFSSMSYASCCRPTFLLPLHPRLSAPVLPSLCCCLCLLPCPCSACLPSLSCLRFSAPHATPLVCAYSVCSAPLLCCL